MLNKINWAEDRSYRTGTDNEPVQFYLESLCNSTHLELLLGHFSSSAINVLSLGFASFLFAGVSVRMVLNILFNRLANYQPLFLQHRLFVLVLLPHFLLHNFLVQDRMKN